MSKIFSAIVSLIFEKVLFFGNRTHFSHTSVEVKKTPESRKRTAVRPALLGMAGRKIDNTEKNYDKGRLEGPGGGQPAA